MGTRIATNAPGPDDDPDHHAVDQALRELDRMDALSADILRSSVRESRSVREIATRLGASPRTVERNLKIARAWLSDRLARV